VTARVVAAVAVASLAALLWATYRDAAAALLLGSALFICS
jgi:hypothetical protein